MRIINRYILIGINPLTDDVEVISLPMPRKDAYKKRKELKCSGACVYSHIEVHKYQPYKELDLFEDDGDN